MAASTAGRAAARFAADQHDPARPRPARRRPPVNRTRYDADRTVAAFARYAPPIKDSVDLNSVRTDLTGVVHGALEPAHVSLWLTPRN